MPLKSRAQFKKLKELESQGKVKPGTADKWMSETKNPQNLPNKVNSKSPKTIQEIKEIRAKKYGK